MKVGSHGKSLGNCCGVCTCARVCVCLCVLVITILPIIRQLFSDSKVLQSSSLTPEHELGFGASLPIANRKKMVATRRS